MSTINATTVAYILLNNKKNDKNKKTESNNNSKENKMSHNTKDSLCNK